MTGNNKVWRAPLAGLASLAMLATMGVAAGTANAETSTNVSDPKVTGDITKTVTYGDSLIDALQGKVPAAADKTAEGKYFLGYYGEDGKPFDFTAPLTKDTKVVAKYEAAAEVVKVTFEGDYGFFPTGSNVVYLKKGTKLDANLAPTDKGGDGKLTDTWSVTGTGVDTTAVKDGKVSSLSDIAVTRPEDNLPNVTVKAGAFKKNVTTLRFNGNSAGYAANSYALNAYADGYVAGDQYADDDLFVDVTSSDYKAPTIITATSEKAGYSEWVNSDDNSKTQVGQSVNTSKGTFEISKDSKKSYVVVKFESNFGSSVASQRVYLTKTDATGDKYGFASEPTAPTRDGYVFKGWYAVQNPSDSDKAFDFVNKPVYADQTLYAKWQATTSQLKVTFRDADYDGNHADVSIKVNGNDFVSEDQAPSWTRDGYVFAGWYSADLKKDFNFDQYLAAEVNDGNDFVLTATWSQVDENTVKAALNYVKLSDEDLFTAGTWADFSATYKKVEKEYKKALFDQTGSKELSKETSAKLVTELKDAWQKLDFKNNEDTAKNVYRLRTGWNNGKYHLWTADPDEYRKLTSNTHTNGQGGWIDEGVAFRVLNSNSAASLGNTATTKGERFIELASFEAAVKAVDPKDTYTAQQLEEFAKPIVKKIYRLNSNVTKEHLYTTDKNEYDVLGNRGWQQEGEAFYVPEYGNTDIYRYYIPSLKQHVWTADGGEYKTVTTKHPDVYSAEGVAFKAL